LRRLIAFALIVYCGLSILPHPFPNGVAADDFVVVQAEVHLDDGSFARAAVPSGASTGECPWPKLEFKNELLLFIWRH